MQDIRKGEVTFHCKPHQFAKSGKLSMEGPKSPAEEAKHGPRTTEAASVEGGARSSHPAQPLEPPQPSGNGAQEASRLGLVPAAAKTPPKRFVRQQASMIVY